MSTFASLSLPLDIMNHILSFNHTNDELYLLYFKSNGETYYKINWNADFLTELNALQHVRFIYPLYSSSVTLVNNRALYTQAKQYYYMYQKHKTYIRAS